MIKLPYPPTVNHYYTVARGRKILSKRGRAFKVAAVAFMQNQKVPKITEGRFSVYIIARCPDKRRRDLDNILKPLLDALGSGGYGAIPDDSHIDDLRITRFNPIKGGSIQILISQWDGVDESS